MIVWMECREAAWRDGLRASALLESMPRISRQRIFSLNSWEILVWVWEYRGCFWRMLLGFSIAKDAGFVAMVVEVVGWSDFWGDKLHKVE